MRDLPTICSVTGLRLHRTHSYPFTQGLLLASALGLLGCGHPIQRTLEGRWMGESVENFSDEVAAAASGWARGTSLEFAGDELTVAIPAEEPRTAPYKIVGVHQKNVRLGVATSDGKQADLRIVLDDERSLRWMLDDNRSVVMRRQ